MQLRTVRPQSRSFPLASRPGRFSARSIGKQLEQSGTVALVRPFSVAESSTVMISPPQGLVSMVRSHNKVAATKRMTAKSLGVGLGAITEEDDHDGAVLPAGETPAAVGSTLAGDAFVPSTPNRPSRHKSRDVGVQETAAGPRSSTDVNGLGDRMPLHRRGGESPTTSVGHSVHTPQTMTVGNGIHPVALEAPMLIAISPASPPPLPARPTMVGSSIAIQPAEFSRRGASRCTGSTPETHATVADCY
ncbi:hypothetical protein BC831DRAFT_58518 [Entophlyctis helioformis]|nr:hypothetical protein BC831DRAFT_58518 [Entophlyctis helioformis]